MSRTSLKACHIYSFLSVLASFERFKVSEFVISRSGEKIYFKIFPNEKCFGNFCGRRIKKPLNCVHKF